MSAAARSLLAVSAILLVATGEKYTTKLTQGSDALWTAVEPFSIRDGRCSRDLEDKLTCDDGLPPDGLQVQVQDNTPFADITVSADLQRGRVRRAAPCEGVAAVTIKLACQFN